MYIYIYIFIYTYERTQKRTLEKRKKGEKAGEIERVRLMGNRERERERGGENRAVWPLYNLSG